MIRIVFKSVYMSTEDKQQLLEKILPSTETASHATITTRAHCQWQLPDTKLKTKLWDEITDPSNKDSLVDYIAKCRAFM